MTINETVKTGLVTQDEICREQAKELAAFEVQETSYQERAEEYADSWFEY